MLQNLSISSARAGRKISLGSLTGMPVYGKESINDTSAPVQEFVWSIPDQYYRLVQPSREEYGLLSFSSRQK